MDDDDPEVAAALAAARAAFDSVRVRADSPAKFKAVSQFAEGFRQLWEDTAAERPGIVRRLRDRDELALVPLSKLSRQLGVSKTRVHQLYVAGRKDPEHV